MPRGLSSTPLPASAVAKACELALQELWLERAVQRVKVEDDWIRARRATLKWWQRNDRKTALACIPQYYSDMWELYRKDDEAVLHALHHMALAAIKRGGSDFTVVVTADDFRLLQKFYAP